MTPKHVKPHCGVRRIIQTDLTISTENSSKPLLSKARAQLTTGSCLAIQSFPRWQKVSLFTSEWLPHSTSARVSTTSTGQSRRWPHWQSLQQAHEVASGGNPKTLKKYKFSVAAIPNFLI
mmetsp:Transcript_17683/g.31797  ORF Transcript_17683/g.31797 Transcript_17683/m.31797 type:complete len:120 (+) Transcript_17683:213-572(+)